MWRTILFYALTWVLLAWNSAAELMSSCMGGGGGGGVAGE